MQKTIKKKVIGEKWWNERAFDQREELCDYEFEHILSISNRLKKQGYDPKLEVDNYSETSSQAAQRKKEEEIQRRYEEYKGIAPKPTAVVPIENENEQVDSDEERAREEKARRKSRKLKKDVPVANVSSKRRSSLSSTGSASSLPESVKSQRSRRGSLQSQKSDKSLRRSQ